MRVVLLALACLLVSSVRAAAECGGDFDVWLDGLRAEATAASIMPATVKRLDGLRPSEKVLAMDGSQRVFSQDWATFSGRMVNAHRLKAGRQHLERYAREFAQAEAEFGVPAPVIAAVWGLETDFGAVQGDFDTLAALATLAHDCRRPDLFRPQLIAALRLLDQGALGPADLKGAWAGELGQLQLLPADYLAFGSDGDGDGQVDLKGSKPDVIRTAARFIRHLGWRPGEPWLEEVRVPGQLPWEMAGLHRTLPRVRWAGLGVTGTDGPLPGDRTQASLLLPMGRRGPAFLAYDNLRVFLRWNQSLVYSSTAAYLATRFAGAPAVRLGDPEPGLDRDALIQLQEILTGLGYDVGETDGILGARTRDALRREQLRLGLPADAWPTPALLRALGEG